MARKLLFTAAGLAGILTPAPFAQTFTPLVQDGYPVAGIGSVTAIDSVAVNDSGSWVAAVFTDASLDRNLVLLRDGMTLLVEDQQMPGSPGFVLQAFDGVTINDLGDSCWNLFLRGGTPPVTETAIYINTTPLLLKDDIVSAAGFSPGTTYVSFTEIMFNNAGDALLIANVDDPAIPGLNDQVALKLDLEGRTLASATTVVRRLDSPAELNGDTITEIEKDPNELAFNDAGDLALVTRTSSGRAALFHNTEVIAREDDPAPELGRTWQMLTSRPLDMNAHGALLFRANLDGDTTDDEVIVLSDPPGRHSIVLREGDPVTTSDGVFRIEDFGAAPIALSDGNDVVVYVHWDQPDATRDEGLFYNGRLIVQEGVTQVGGSTVESLMGGVPSLFSLSPDGNYLAFRCVLTSFVDALVLADLRALPGPFCDASDGSLTECPCPAGGSTSGCEVARGTGGVRLRLGLQRSTPINRATLVGTGFPAMSSTPNVLLRSQSVEQGAVVFGNGLRCVGLPTVRLRARLASDGLTTHVLGHGSVAGEGTFYYQLWFRDMPLSYCDPVSGFNLSNGRELTWP